MKLSSGGSQCRISPHRRVNTEQKKHLLYDIQVQSGFMRLLLGNGQQRTLYFKISRLKGHFNAEGHFN